MSEPDWMQRIDHRVALATALSAAEFALESADKTGRRKDCLRVAVQALYGALSNVYMEDKLPPLKPLIATGSV